LLSEFCWGGFKAQQLVQAIAAQLRKSVTEHQIVHGELAQLLLVQHGMEDKG